MNRAEETRRKDVVRLWKNIGKVLLPHITGSIEEKKKNKLIALADRAIRHLTGARQSKLDERLSCISDLGDYGENCFRALSQIRLQKAHIILNNMFGGVKSVMGGVLSMDDRIECILQSIGEMFEKGGKQIAEYEKEDTRISLPSKGVKILITDGVKSVKAEVASKEIVGEKTSGRPALMIMEGSFKGMIATPGQLSVMYRTLFPGDDRKFFVADHFMWDPVKMPSDVSVEAVEVAKEAWFVTDIESRSITEEAERAAFTPEIKEGMKGVKLKRLNTTPSWKSQVAFTQIFDTNYSQDFVNRNLGSYVEEPVVEEESSPILTLKGPLPSTLEKVKEEYEACIEYMGPIQEDIKRFAGINKLLAAARIEVLRLEDELRESCITKKDVSTLWDIALRWENLYACIPKISKDLDERKDVLEMIDQILRPISGENKEIFNAMEEFNGKE